MNTKVITSVLLTLSIYVAACKSKVQEQTLTTSSTAVNQSQVDFGLSLAEANCFTCHAYDADVENNIAPSI
jgi:cytochrome c2